MPKKGLSLHIGLNRVDPSHYGGWEGQLAACEYDAKDMQAIARTRGFKAQMLLTRRATSAAVISTIAGAAKTLKKGDLFWLTYSGHGGQVPDTNDDEKDGRDETWVLYDRQLVDDELYALWAKFAAGVRIVVLSDSCHSGTVTRALPTYLALRGGGARASGLRFRVLPDAVRRKTYAKNKALYEKIQKSHGKGDQVAMGATVLLISGCQDNQLSSDGNRNGLFTGKLRKVWNKGKFDGGHRTFRSKIAALMPPTQTPRYTRVGAPHPTFERQKPFTV